MIIARLQGGLGNQLFQYAAAKALAVKLNVPFKLDAFTSLQKDKQRTIALHDFRAGFELASKKEIKGFIFFPSLYRHQPAFFARLGRHVYREPHFHFDQHFSRITAPVFIDGFWQSPLYFKDIDAVIRQDFTIKEELIKNVKEKGIELAGRDSVAVHIRRGDFLNRKIKAFHGVMDVGYYSKAIAVLQQKIPGLSVHFFSDDIEWVKKNLPFDNAEFVSVHTRSATEDFYLMTQCRHTIIANSSFSWWTAWLNNHPEKIVVAPKKWFVKEEINTADLVPAGWLRI
ncbi:MAG: alpha-1,2-fucosyltransferase [Chitinophagaceae bacterium]|nr:alpha-1,2-fucosyltransferase [Chitinophagaceae bacterium]